MIKAIKIRLFPTKEQELLMLKSIGCSRFAYNWALGKCNERYKNNEKYSISDIRKEFTQLKKEEDFKWLNEVSSHTTQEAIRNLNKAFKEFFNKKSNYPKFKSKRKSKQSFYVRCDNLYFKDNLCNIEKIGKVKFKTNRIIPKDSKYSNPYCSFNGRCWVLSFGVEVKENQITLNQDLSIGIDLGISKLATCSNGKVFKNINKSKRVKNLKSKLRHLQRNVSRKYESNKQENRFIKTNNIIKLENQIKKIYRKLSNIRNNHIHQTTNNIIKYYPYRIVMEDLNIKGMMKNRHLSRAIAEQCFYEFIRQMEYKCKFNGIEFIVADRWFPSSKTCSCCGSIKKDLKLKDRVYKCNCGLSIDRDLNASINLSNYSKA